MVTDKLIVYCVMIVRKASRSEYVDQIFLDENMANAYAKKVAKEWVDAELDTDNMQIEIEAFTVNDSVLKKPKVKN